jgi:hypothetical protein
LVAVNRLPVIQCGSPAPRFQNHSGFFRLQETGVSALGGPPVRGEGGWPAAAGRGAQGIEIKRALSCLILVLAGCQSDPDLQRIHRTPPGCYTQISQHGEAVERDVVPAPAVQERLLQMIPPAERAATHCWFLTPARRLKLVVEEACGPHSEYEFERKVHAWMLARSHREELVLCHRRVR